MHKYLNGACKEDRLFSVKKHSGRTRGNIHRRFFPNYRKHFFLCEADIRLDREVVKSLFHTDIILGKLLKVALLEQGG